MEKVNVYEVNGIIVEMVPEEEASDLRVRLALYLDAVDACEEN